MKVNFLDLRPKEASRYDEIMSAVRGVIDSAWFVRGEAVSRFESHYAEYIGSKYCVGVGNGLDALTLMLRAYKELGRLSDGDEVIVPANTFIATILSITSNGLTPIFAEPTYDGLVLDMTKLESLVTSRTRAVMTVHLYGRCAYSQSLSSFCERHGLLLFEDNAQAHGCVYEQDGLMRKTGSLGVAAAHSFYPGKNLGAYGDGGAVTTDDRDVAETVRSLGNYGSSSKYIYEYQGVNSRLDEIQAAVLDVKLRHLDEDNRRRREIASFYYDNIRNDNVTLPSRLPDHQNAYHLFPVLAKNRDGLGDFLKSNDIQTICHYPVPAHQQECYKQYADLSLPITERLSREELSIPIGPVMTDEEVRYVTETINAFCG